MDPPVRRSSARLKTKAENSLREQSDVNSTSSMHSYNTRNRSRGASERSDPDPSESTGNYASFRRQLSLAARITDQTDDASSFSRRTDPAAQLGGYLPGAHDHTVRGAVGPYRRVAPEAEARADRPPHADVRPGGAVAEAAKAAALRAVMEVGQGDAEPIVHGDNPSPEARAGRPSQAAGAAGVGLEPGLGAPFAGRVAAAAKAAALRDVAAWRADEAAKAAALCAIKQEPGRSDLEAIEIEESPSPEALVGRPPLAASWRTGAAAAVAGGFGPRGGVSVKPEPGLSSAELNFPSHPRSNPSPLPHPLPSPSAPGFDPIRIDDTPSPPARGVGPAAWRAGGAAAAGGAGIARAGGLKHEPGLGGDASWLEPFGRIMQYAQGKRGNPEWYIVPDELQRLAWDRLRVLVWEGLRNSGCDHEFEEDDGRGPLMPLSSSDMAVAQAALASCGYWPNEAVPVYKRSPQPKDGVRLPVQQQIVAYVNDLLQRVRWDIINDADRTPSPISADVEPIEVGDTPSPEARAGRPPYAAPRRAGAVAAAKSAGADPRRVKLEPGLGELEPMEVDEARAGRPPYAASWRAGGAAAAPAAGAGPRRGVKLEPGLGGGAAAAAVGLAGRRPVAVKWEPIFGDADPFVLEDELDPGVTGGVLKDSSSRLNAGQRTLHDLIRKGQRPGFASAANILAPSCSAGPSSSAGISSSVASRRFVMPRPASGVSGSACLVAPERHTVPRVAAAGVDDASTAPFFSTLENVLNHLHARQRKAAQAYNEACKVTGKGKPLKAALDPAKSKFMQIQVQYLALLLEFLMSLIDNPPPGASDRCNMTKWRSTYHVAVEGACHWSPKNNSGVVYAALLHMPVGTAEDPSDNSSEPLYREVKFMIKGDRGVARPLRRHDTLQQIMAGLDLQVDGLSQKEKVAKHLDDMLAGLPWPARWPSYWGPQQRGSEAEKLVTKFSVKENAVDEDGTEYMRLVRPASLLGSGKLLNQIPVTNTLRLFAGKDTIYEMESFARDNILNLMKEDAWWTKSTGRDWKPPALPGAEKSHSQVFRLTGSAS
ncbi:hypothetical protein PLESTF_001978500 [Pleodorina starrii]|nr:hypothetical protein PLESTF_001978500 [Pleodorina starrii]